MPVGSRHEHVLELVEQVPGLLESLIELNTGKEVPEYDSVDSAGESATIREPIEVFADSVRVFRKNGRPRLAVIVEMQHRPSKKKLFDWPHFLFGFRVEHGCPTVLVVLTVSAKTAEWAREPIDGGLGQSLVRPIVICLDELEPQSDLGLNLLFAFADRSSQDNLEHLADALATIPADQAKRYADILLGGLRGDAADTWRELMKRNYQMYQNEYAQELLARGREEGQTQGEARSILRVLAARGIAVPDRISRKILACQDQSQLDHWLDQAAVTDDIERLFSE
jgi:hypothetical protein